MWAMQHGDAEAQYCGHVGRGTWSRRASLCVETALFNKVACWPESERAQGAPNEQLRIRQLDRARAI